jgi:hypothetical protein
MRGKAVGEKKKTGGKRKKSVGEKGKDNKEEVGKEITRDR